MLKHVDGFDHLQGQSAATLLSSVAAGGYSSSIGLAMAAGRHENTFALELQVSPGTAGQSWSQRQNSTPQAQRGVATNSVGRWSSVGDAGSAATTTDGVTWTPLITGTSKNLKDIESDGSVWIIVGDQTILRSTDGRNFVPVSMPVTTANLRAVETDGGQSWLAVGSNGTVGVIFRSTDGGVTWANIVVTQLLPLLAAKFANNHWMVGGNGGTLMTSPDMTSWTKQTFGVSTPVTALAYGDAQWLATTGRDIRRSLDEGVNWGLAVASLIPSGTLNGLGFADSRWIVIGDGGTLRLSDDSGVSWEAASSAGLGTTALYGMTVSRGTQVGWAAVGNKIGGSSGTAAIFQSLAPPTYLSRTVLSDGDKLVIGWAHNATARGRMLSMGLLFDVDWPSTISILGVSGTAIPAKNVWYYYELVIDKLDLTVSLYINNTLDLIAPLPGAGSINQWNVTWISENGSITRLDDIYILDDTSPDGEALLDRLGPIQVPIRMPTEDFSPNDWVGSSSDPHYTLIGLLPPSTESFIRSNIGGAQDLYKSAAGLPAGAGDPSTPILAVGVMALAQKGDIDNRQLGLVVGEVGNQIEVIDTEMSIDPEYSYAVFEKAPGGAPWDATNTLSTPFGVVVRP